VSSGIPTAFSLYTAGLSGQRSLVGLSGGLYPCHVRNATNAARNLVETIADSNPRRHQRRVIRSVSTPSFWAIS